MVVASGEVNPSALAVVRDQYTMSDLMDAHLVMDMLADARSGAQAHPGAAALNDPEGW